MRINTCDFTDAGVEYCRMADGRVRFVPNARPKGPRLGAVERPRRPPRRKAASLTPRRRGGVRTRSAGARPQPSSLKRHRPARAARPWKENECRIATNGAEQCKLGGRVQFVSPTRDRRRRRRR